MNYRISAYTLRNLSRNKKFGLIFFADFITAFLCWIIFGPPLTFLIATNFSESLLTIIYDNIISFIVPALMLFMYFFLFGFYKSLLKFFDSKDSIFRAMIGSFIFGFAWGIVYLAQYEVIRTTF